MSVYRIHVQGSNKPAVVDADVFHDVSRFGWYLDPDGYPVRNVETRYRETFGWRMRLSKHVMIFHKHMVDKENNVHNINFDRLDCRYRNLVILDPSHLGGTAKLSKANTSGFKGVSKRGNGWLAYITTNRKRIHLGTFDDKVSAALAYNKAAIKYFGEHANINIIEA